MPIGGGAPRQVLEDVDRGGLVAGWNSSRSCVRRRRSTGSSSRSARCSFPRPTASAAAGLARRRTDRFHRVFGNGALRERRTSGKTRTCPGAGAPRTVSPGVRPARRSGSSASSSEARSGSCAMDLAGRGRLVVRDPRSRSRSRHLAGTATFSSSARSTPRDPRSAADAGERASRGSTGPVVACLSDRRKDDPLRRRRRGRRAERLRLSSRRPTARRRPARRREGARSLGRRQVGAGRDLPIGEEPRPAADRTGEPDLPLDGHFEVGGGAFSPPDGGARLRRERAGRDTTRAYIVDLAGGKPRRVTEKALPVGAAVSPDGKWIAALGPTGDRDSMPPDGGGPTPVRARAERHSDPVGADGEALRDARRRDLPGPNYRYSVATGKESSGKSSFPPIARGSSGIENVSSHRDGKSYAYSFGRVTNSDLYVVGAEVRRRRRMALERALKTKDIVLFNVAAIVGMRWIALAAANGPSSLISLGAGGGGFLHSAGVRRDGARVGDPRGRRPLRLDHEGLRPATGFLAGWLYWANEHHSTSRR